MKISPSKIPSFAIRVANAMGAFVLLATIITSQAIGAGQNWADWWEKNPGYLSPIDLQISPDGKRLYVVCQTGNQVLAVDTRTERVVGIVKVGRKPEAIALSPDGKTIYVSNEWSDSVSVIRARSLIVERTLRAGWGPVGLTTDQSGKFLYVANTTGDDVSIINLATGREIKRLAAGRFPEYIHLSSDGRRVYVANLLSLLHPYNEPPTSEITVISTRRQEVTDRVLVPGAIELRHITQMPRREGGYLLIPELRPKNLNALVQIPQGWYVTNGLAVVETRGAVGGEQKREGGRAEVHELLLDGMNHFYADGAGAAASPNGRWALITASSAGIVSLIDVAKLNQLLARIPANDPNALADRLDSARQFVVARLKVGHDPTSAVISPNSEFAYVTNRLDDTISVVNLTEQRVTSTIHLGGPTEVTILRRGEQLFHDSNVAYEGAMACATCHPHGGLSDGLTWSLETPTLGHDLVQNKTLRAIRGTAPFKWNGLNPNLATQDGPRSAMYIFRSQGFSAKEVQELTAFIRSLPAPPNPFHSADDPTPAEERGRAIFFRTRTNDGRIIPPDDRCYYCHSPHTDYTSRVIVNVGTATKHDTIKAFKVPSLVDVWMRPPYLHNGEALTLEEIWTKFNPDDKHGFTSDMNKAQLNDLIEFLKTL